VILSLGDGSGKRHAFVSGAAVQTGALQFTVVTGKAGTFKLQIVIPQCGIEMRALYLDQHLVYFFNGGGIALRLNRRVLIGEQRQHVHIAPQTAFHLEVQSGFDGKVSIRTNGDAADESAALAKRAGFQNGRPGQAGG